MAIEEIAVLTRHLEYAKRCGPLLGCLNNSITSGEANVHSYLGEILMKDRTGGLLHRTFDYDLIMSDGSKVDVKTKRCNSVPRPDYECSIAATSLHQKCDFYLFVRVLCDMSRAWFLGAIRRGEYFRLSVFHRKGEPDPASGCGWVFKADCFNLPIHALHEDRAQRERHQKLLDRVRHGVTR